MRERLDHTVSLSETKTLTSRKDDLLKHLTQQA